MIKGIDNKKVSITDAEYEIYQRLVDKWGAGCFKGVFETDEGGKITIIVPKKGIPWEVLFFLQNLMINQHLHDFDNRLTKLEKKIGE